MELLEGSSLLDEFDIVKTRDKRATCSKCNRPERACWCPHLPQPRISIGDHKLLIIQHPGEGGRRLKTAPMLQQGLEPGACDIVVSRKCNGVEWDLARNRWKDHKWLLLYPSDDAKVAEDLDPQENYVVVMLDGTWPEARAMYMKSPNLTNMPRVKIASSSTSEYIIRTQPTDACLSTVEAGATLLAEIVRNPSIYDSLVSPLRALVRCQLAYGAVEHETGQQRALQAMSASPDSIPKRTIRKLKKCGLDLRDSKLLGNS